MSWLLTVKELANLLHIHPKTVYRWKQIGKLPFLTKNGLIRFKRENIEEWIEKDSFKPVQIPALPSVDFSLGKYDKLMLKGGKSALGKTPKRWNYGFGSIYLRKTKNGKDRWYVDFKYNGQRKREVVNDAQGRGEALIALQRRVAEIFNGKYHPQREIESPKFIEFSEKFLQDYSKKEKKSWKTDECRLKKIGEFFGAFRLKEITGIMILNFRESRLKQVISRLTINRECALLKKMFNWAIEKGYLQENPVRKVKMYSEKDTARDRVLSQKEEANLLQELAVHLKPIIIFALHTGLRYREILELKWKNVDLERRHIKVEHTKSGKVRFIPVNSILFAELVRLKQAAKGEKVFPWRNVRTGFENACRRAKIANFTFHDLRRTFGTRLLERGVDIVTISKLYGHSSVLVTQNYLHPADELSKKAVELLTEEPQRGAHFKENLAHIWHTEKEELPLASPKPRFIN
jgi:excisionase family DNA binding protein